LLVASAALPLIAIPLELMIGGTKFFPADALITGNAWKVAGVYMSWQQVLVVAALAGAGVALAWFFARTDLGLATLATSQEPTASRLVGIRLNRISMLTWGMAGLLGGLAGVLLAPVTGQFQAGYGTTTVLIGGFTAAVVGGMDSVRVRAGRNRARALVRAHPRARTQRHARGRRGHRRRRPQPQRPHRVLGPDLARTPGVRRHRRLHVRLPHHPVAPELLPGPRR